MSDRPSDANEHCPGTGAEDAGKASACAGCPNQKLCASGEANRPDPDLERIRVRMASVKHKILVLSGKGGVGKSTVSTQLAFGLADRGFQVGLLDIDICGPSAPRMFGLSGESVHRSASGWSPVYVEDNLGVMSIGFMLPDPDAAVIWRGPRKNGLIKQFLSDVDWGELDFLIVDTPPGTSDEHITAVQALTACGVDGAVVVTTPQEIAMMDVRKELGFCMKTSLRVIGVVENMSRSFLPLSDMSFVDESGRDRTDAVIEAIRESCPEVLQARALVDIFPAANGGAEAMANRFRVPFLGRMPLDRNLLLCGENGRQIGKDSGATASAVRKIIDAVLEATGERGKTGTT